MLGEEEMLAGLQGGEGLQGGAVAPVHDLTVTATEIGNYRQEIAQQGVYASAGEAEHLASNYMHTRMPIFIIQNGRFVEREVVGQHQPRRNNWSLVHLGNHYEAVQGVVNGDAVGTESNWIRTASAGDCLFESMLVVSKGGPVTNLARRIQNLRDEVSANMPDAFIERNIQEMIMYGDLGRAGEKTQEFVTGRRRETRERQQLKQEIDEATNESIDLRIGQLASLDGFDAAPLLELKQQFLVQKGVQADSEETQLAYAQLRDRLEAAGARLRQQRHLGPEADLGIKESAEQAELRVRILKLERLLLSWLRPASFEQRELTALRRRIDKELAPQLEAIGNTKDGEEQAGLQKAYELRRDELEAEYRQREQVYAKLKEEAPEKLRSRLEEKRLEWIGLMEQLCGTHVGTSAKPKEYSRLASRRHDGLPGLYGRQVTERLGDRRLEVLHGHGAWTRSGLLSRAMKPDLPGVTSLRQIINRANKIRAAANKRLIDPALIELAFTGDHGIPTTDGKSRPHLPNLAKSASSSLFDITPDIVEEVQAMMAAKSHKGETMEAKIKRLCKEVDPNYKWPPKSYREKRKQEGNPVIPDMRWRSDRARHLYDAFMRMQSDQLQGELSDYADLLGGGEHADVPFPDLRLSSLKGALAKESDPEPLGGFQFRNSMLGLPFRNVHMSLYENFSRMPKEQREVGNTSEDNEGAFQLCTSVRLSDAITHKLAELEDTTEQVRFLWSACRSEVLPPTFGEAEFRRWLQQAADALGL